jgi:uncharacterized protein (TIGR01777 family)
MRIVVSGSSGLIGTALVAALTTAGHDVIRLRRSTATGRLGDAEVQDAVRGADAIVNLAGVGIGDHRWTSDYRARLIRSRVDATQTLAHAAAETSSHPAVISASAVGYYGSRGDEILTEDSPSGAGFLADLCRQWEGATAEAEAAGRRVVHLRTGVVMAAHGGALRKQLPLFRLGLGGRLGSGRQWVSWISLEDEVGAILHAVASDVSGPLNLAAPDAITNAEFTKALGAALRRPTWAAVPRAALAMAFGREMCDEMILASQRAQPTKLVGSGFRFSDPELGGALRRVLAEAG